MLNGSLVTDLNLLEEVEHAVRDACLASHLQLGTAQGQLFDEQPQLRVATRHPPPTHVKVWQMMHKSLQGSDSGSMSSSQPAQGLALWTMVMAQ